MNSLTDSVQGETELPAADTAESSTHEAVFSSKIPGAAMPTEKTRLHQRAGLRQLVKFCLVGLSSTVVDKGLLWILQGAKPLWPWWACATISFCFGVSNGFLWNRLWTFRAHGEGHSRLRDQYWKFFVSNSVGLALNLFFTKIFIVVLTGQVWHEVNPPRFHVLLASLCAAPIVVIWNFTVAKYWTFRKSPGEDECKMQN